MIRFREPDHVQTLGLIDRPSPAVEEPTLRASDYWPFAIGVLIIGGLILVPLAMSWEAKASYLEALPWSVASALAILLSMRNDGRLPIQVNLFIFVLALGAGGYGTITGRTFHQRGIVLIAMLLLSPLWCGRLCVWMVRMIWPRDDPHI
ncbi:MAG: hypothetical protein D6723_10565 [Acidobacteria bacterium]|nr:MAG: hypothetical protein D6723_10565 [Acidobacteriota bacterium]